MRGTFQSRGPGHREDRSYWDFYRLAPPRRVRSDRHLERILAALLRECGPDLIAVLLFGSRLVGSEPDRHSAYDLVLVVDRYADLFRRLNAEDRLHRSPRLFTLLSHTLPPTNISYRTEPAAPVLAKCMVLSEEHLEKALSDSAPDHFCLGRLIHRVALVHARSPTEKERMIEILAGARRTALSWVAPFVEEPFSVEEFTRTMLQVSFSGEIRPESGTRAGEVVRSQDRFLLSVYGRLLETACQDGILVRDGDRFRYATPPSVVDRLRWRIYFWWSRMRSTIRWFKHMLTFEEWLDYIHHKVERRMGLDIELSERERKYPLIFLWPKLVRVLRARGASASTGRDAGGRDDL